MTRSKDTQRLRLISVGVIVLTLIFILKLYMLQVVHHDSFVKLADRQYVKKNGSVFSRGSVFFEDKNGNLVSAATLKTGYVVAINPKTLKNKDDAYQKLSSIITLDKDSFFAKANKADDPYEEIAKHVPEDKGLAIQNLKLTGVSLYKEQWRFYPGGSIASNVLGFLGYKGDEYAGRYGLENFYEKVLERNSDNVYANFFVEVFSNIEKSISKDASFEGDLVATIEPSVQSSLEDTVLKIQNKWGGDETGGIIMDPKTGAIYAMGKVPTFDPNNFQKEKDVSVFSNPLVDRVREMGSIIKPLTIAAGIDAGVITPETTYKDNGYVIANGAKIWNHDKKGHGVIPMQEVLNQSLNTGVAFVVSKLGNDKFRDYMLKYGLGEKTGIDLPNEAQNIIANLKSPRDVEYITASFGQGIALTPIATIRALASLANGGILPNPHVIKKVEYTTGFSKSLETEGTERVISAESAKKITDMLVKVVDTALVHGKFKNEHYTVGAKTGTAQVARPDGGGYYDDRVLHSFFGFFPAYNPRFIILLYTYNPKSDNFAADTLAEPFMDISKFLINYYQLPPDR